MQDEFLFADDMAKGAPTEEKMQKGVDQVSDSCDFYDLTISIKTTEVVYQPAPGKPYKETTITVKGQRLQMVDKFTYLGGTSSRVVHIDDEVNARIAIASAAFGRLCGSIWDRSGIRRHKAESIKIGSAANTIICKRNLDSYQRHAKNTEKKVREKSRECHNHKPQPFPDPKRKRKPTNLNKHKPNKPTKSTKISSLFPKRGSRNTKRTEKHKNKMTHGK